MVEHDFMSKIIAKIFLFFSFLLFIGCTGNHLAPVVEIGGKNYLYHIVKPRETLRMIATQYQSHYRHLAKLNNLHDPYKIHVGQRIIIRELTPSARTQRPTRPRVEPLPNHRVNPPSPPPTTKPVSSQKISADHPSMKQWQQPAHGKITQLYGPNNKGVNFSGHKGDPIFAAANGKVIYSGNGLRGYGNLLIIRHNDIFLSAYAHNDQLLVKEGASVRAGQKIATMGDTETDKVMLHFEIRQHGKPINPLIYIRE